MEELSYLLYISVICVTAIATAAYIVFFISQNKGARKIARTILTASGILQSLYIVSRYLLAGYTPITRNISMDDA